MRLVSLVTVLFLLVTACADTPTSARLARDLDDARETWSRHLDFYDYELTRTCDSCVGPTGSFRLTVVDGTVCVITPLDPGVDQVPAGVFAPNIDGLLTFVADRLDDGTLETVEFTDEGLPSRVVLTDGETLEASLST
ncbi:MAG: DUF6174 domain-containing protein [Euzebya sp.]